MMDNPRVRRPHTARETPRRVVGGLRPTRIEPDQRHWAAQRWLRLLDEITDGETFREGLEYADLGQTRFFEIVLGGADAQVQGRRARAYRVELRLAPLPAREWDRIASAINEDASLAAPMLAGELPRRIEDVFTRQTSHKPALFPLSIGEIVPSCGCAAAKGSWCKHAVCTARLTADALQQNPSVIFLMRGIEPAELLDRLRRRRAAEGSAIGATPAYMPRIDLPASMIPHELEACLDHFWETDFSIFDRIDATPHAPIAPTHALLRRLGPSPFTDSRFPLVGLLASCYDEIAVSAQAGMPASPAEAQAGLDPEASAPEQLIE